MSRRTMGKYDIGLKRQATEEVVNLGKRQCDVARAYGLSDKLISNWVKHYKAGTAWARSSEQVASDEALHRLHKENKRLKMEVEILKKASVYFAKNLK